MKTFHLVAAVAVIGLCSHCDGVHMANTTRGLNPDSIGRTAGKLIAPNTTLIATPQAFGEEIELLRFNSRVPDQPEIITMKVEPVANTTNGPLVGVLGFASGGAQKPRIEFDIPVAINTAYPAPPAGASNTVTFGGGVLLTFPASSFELAARNDSSFAPRFGDTSIGSDASFPTLWPQVTASFVAGDRSGGSNLTRTIWLVNNLAAGLAAASSINNVPIPRYATSFMVSRVGAPGNVSAAFSVSINRPNTAFDGPFGFPAGGICPVIPLSGNATSLTIANTGAIAITQLAVVFFLSL